MEEEKLIKKYAERWSKIQEYIIQEKPRENLFEEEKDDQNTKSCRNIKKNKDQELMTCLNYLEVTGIYFEKIVSVMGQ